MTSMSMIQKLARDPKKSSSPSDHWDSVGVFVAEADIVCGIFGTD